MPSDFALPQVASRQVHETWLEEILHQLIGGKHPIVYRSEKPSGW